MRTTGGGTAPKNTLAKSLLRQSHGQVDFGLRRFRLGTGQARQRLEDSARAFLEGVNAVVENPGVEATVDSIERFEPQWRGFAYEGAGMGCALLDLVTLSRGRRSAALLEGVGNSYPHLVHTGMGWAHARLRLRPWWGLPVGDPLLRWLGWDGFGFHQGFFRSDAVIGACRLERGLSAGHRAVRDQGLGRALWFHECADPDGVARRVAHFPVHRRADLWSGVGLAATYAGGAGSAELERLAGSAGRYAADLAQGSVFACAARWACGIGVEHTEQAATALTGVSAAEAAGWAELALAALGDEPHSVQHYERWRAEIRALWSRHHRAKRSESRGAPRSDEEKALR
ncbi:hypothetical protein FHR84_000988 [Actinopolyspora biskrensis]|uniref:DUF1702 family protein n=1 Tax=Actinopolyspora biskrensis TaxID=1470178 RepID=A0A852YR12_9ACTN|nr:DUF1702 family protein [Actinopolyspora biskrensis]NYH77674.1 hypothetical protein [Actinopolyspora biskrensis]